MIYLDNAASTKPKQEVIDVMVESMKEFLKIFVIMNKKDLK